MAQTTWKQVVLDTADAIREANGTSDKIPVGQIADKVRAGAGTPYEGDNPLTIGAEGYNFPAKTLLKDGLQIINGVNGEDLTEPITVQETAVETLLREVKRRVADHKGEGEFVWKKLTAEGGDFIDYVVSSDELAYPNGGELGGYWYELVEETNLASELGFKNVAIDKFTFSSDKAAGDGTVVTHSLGEVPKFSVVLSADRACVANNVYIGATGKITGDNKRGWAVLMGSSNSLKGTGGELSGTAGTFTENSITPLPITYSSYKYSAGVEYTLITMA